MPETSPFVYSAKLSNWKSILFAVSITVCGEQPSDAVLFLS